MTNAIYHDGKETVGTSKQAIALNGTNILLNITLHCVNHTRQNTCKLRMKQTQTVFQFMKGELQGNSLERMET